MREFLFKLSRILTAIGDWLDYRAYPEHRFGCPGMFCPIHGADEYRR